MLSSAAKEWLISGSAFCRGQVKILKPMESYMESLGCTLSRSGGCLHFYKDLWQCSVSRSQMEDEAAEGGQRNSISQVLTSSHRHVITPALPVKAGRGVRPFLPTNPKPSILSRCLVAMETPLLLKLLLILLCASGHCFRPRIPPTANLYEGVLLGATETKSQLNQSQGCDQKNRRTVTWLMSHKSFPVLFSFSFILGGWGGQVFCDSLHFTNETLIHSFSHFWSANTYQPFLCSCWLWALQIQETWSYSYTFK